MRKFIYALICILLLTASAFAEGYRAPLMYGTSYDGLPYVRFNLGETTTCVEGLIKWNDDDKTMDICTENGDVTIQSGQEMHVRGTNKTGSTLTNGQVVYIDGAQGSRPTFALANATSEDTSERTIGIVTADILDNATGYVTTTGLVRDIDTSALAAGDVAYLSTTPGGFTNTSPASPNHMVSLGVVIRSHADEGIIYVTVINGFEVTELHDVTVTSPQADDSLLYNGTIWVNVPPTYGQIFYHSDTDTLNIATTTALVNVTGLTDDIFNNMTIDGSNGTITIIDTGPYFCTFTMSHQSATPADFDHHIGVDGVDQDVCHSNRTIATGTQAGGVPLSCRLELTSGESVTGMVNSANNETIRYESLNVGCDMIK
jgi:hypothetical protein